MPQRTRHAVGNEADRPEEDKQADPAHRAEPPSQRAHRSKKGGIGHIEHHLPSGQRCGNPVDDALGPVRSAVVRLPGRCRFNRGPGRKLRNVRSRISLADHEAAIGMRDDLSRRADQIGEVRLVPGCFSGHGNIDLLDQLLHVVQRDIDTRNAVELPLRTEDRGIDAEHGHVRAAAVEIRFTDGQLAGFLRAPIPEGRRLVDVVVVLVDRGGRIGVPVNPRHGHRVAEVRILECVIGPENFVGRKTVHDPAQFEHHIGVRVRTTQPLHSRHGGDE